MPSRFRIDASHRRDTRVLTLTCKTLDPTEAARIANKYAEIFVRESAKESTYVTQQMLKWIPEDLEMPARRALALPVESRLRPLAASLARIEQEWGDPDAAPLESILLQVFRVEYGAGLAPSGELLRSLEVPVEAR